MERGRRQCSAGKARTLVTGGIDTNLVREVCKGRQASHCFGSGCLLYVTSYHS